MVVTVYTKPQCVQCNMTYRALDAKGISYTKVDITEDAQALEMVKSLGYMQAPRRHRRRRALVRLPARQDQRSGSVTTLPKPVQTENRHEPHRHTRIRSTD